MRILFALLLLAGPASGQITKQVITTDRSQVTSFIETVLSTTIAPYRYLRTDSGEYKNTITFIYAGADSTIEFCFYKVRDKDKPEWYQLASIRGRYEDLFPFWKDNFQQQADSVKIKDNGHGDVIQIKVSDKLFVFTLNEQRFYWELGFKKY